MQAGFGVCRFSRWAIGPELADGTLIAKPVGLDGLTLDWSAVMRAEDAGDTAASRLVHAMQGWGDGKKTGLETLAFETMA